MLERALAELALVLGDDFDITPYRRTGEDVVPDLGHLDLVVNVNDRATGVGTTLFVEAKQDVNPGVLRRELLPRYELLRRMPSSVPSLVVAPWLSPRSRTELEALGVNYLDFTGNARIDLKRPRVLVILQGQQRDPRPKRRTVRGVSGPGAARVIRLLAEVDPPFRAKQLQDASGLSLPYVTRILDVIAERGLIDRDGRDVVAVDWVGVLRERAAVVSLLRTNPAVAFVARRGLDHTLDRLAATDRAHVAVTGSYAAREIAPVSVGGQLMVYVPGALHAMDTVADELGLLRAPTGGDVLLLRPGDEGVFDRTRTVDGVVHVGWTQLVLDCLSGPGRLPAEGEAILDVMAKYPTLWRLDRMPQRSDAHDDRGSEWPGSLRE